MKNSALTCLFLFICLCFGIVNAQETRIPHYEIYPATPQIDYEGEILDFYSVKQAFGEFSNFALFPIVIEGVEWPTSEHYYQAHKYIDPVMREKVRQAITPYEAAQIGRDPNIPKRDDWVEVKDGVMEIAVRAKFGQYTVLRSLLLHTKQAALYEHTKLDCYWGDCGDRTGQNKLGLLLMKLRSEFQR